MSMAFRSPSWVQALPFEPPDDVPLTDFVFDEQYGRAAFDTSSPLFVCGYSGKQWMPLEYKQRIENAASGLGKAMGWSPNHSSEWSKVACIYCPNTIDYVAAAWSVLRLGGVCAPLGSECTVEEAVNHLRLSGAKCIFTTLTHLQRAREAAGLCGIEEDRIFLLEMPSQLVAGKKRPEHLVTLDQLIESGSRVRLEKLRFQKGQGARQTAYLCSSSGTSGLPKGVMLSHRNIITNVLQTSTYEAPNRAWFAQRKGVNAASYREVALALLPFSHAYGLTVISTMSAYRGDTALVLPKFELRTLLRAIQEFHITTLYAVPPIVIQLKNNAALCREFDLSSVDSLICGSAPLGYETHEDLARIWPRWIIRQIYGCTESTALITGPTPVRDLVVGSVGCLLPGVEMRIVGPDGADITKPDQRGELVVRSSAVVQGYLHREDATREAFRDGGWLHTGDEAMVCRSANGREHVWITDRLKEMMKVKGFQVAPAELEAHLLRHPAVADCAVISVPDEYAGELPKAYVVRAAGCAADAASDAGLVEDIKEHVKQHKARHKWLAGGVEFINSIPKTTSGKIQRRLLRDRERAKRHLSIAAPKERQPWVLLLNQLRGLFPFPWKFFQGFLPAWSTRVLGHVGLGKVW